MSQQKPHVLLLINDEHRPDVLPIEGDQQVRTPTLDRFINEDPRDNPNALALGQMA